MKKLLLILLILILGYLYYPKIKSLIFQPTAMDTFMAFNQSDGDYWKINHLITKEYNDRFWRYPEKIAQQHLKQRHAPVDTSTFKEHSINEKTVLVEADVVPKRVGDYKKPYCFVLEKHDEEWKVAGSNPWNEVYPDLLDAKIDSERYKTKSFFTYDDQIMASKSAWAYIRGGKSIRVEFYDYPMNNQMIYDLSYGSSDLYHWKKIAKEYDTKFRKFEFSLVLDKNGLLADRSQSSITFYRQDTNWKSTHKVLWMPKDVISFVEYKSGRLKLISKGEDNTNEGKTFSWDIDLEIPMHEQGCDIE